MILYFDRFLQKIIRAYRKKVFIEKIKCQHKSFNLVGSVNVINTNITLGKNVTIYPDVMFFGDGPIVIGDNVDIGNNTIIYSSKNGGVTIGSNTMVAAQCYIIDMDHGLDANIPIMNQQNSVKAVKIGDDVWLAANVTVLKGSNIGDGAIIGAKALVKGDIPSNAVAVGTPAKVIKYRE